MSGLDLVGVDLSAAKLKAANLEGTDLRGASLVGANLNDANLSRTDLRDANLRQARMVHTHLQGALLDGSNLFATIREAWLIKGVTCSSCWITRDRATSMDSPDKFLENEFETVYGGIRVKVAFPGEFQPIDLLSLPYHVSRLMEEFPGRRVILTGLDTTREPRLEFRLDEEAEMGASQELEALFQRFVPETRVAAQNMYVGFLEAAQNEKNELLKQNNRLISLLESIVQRPTSAMTIGTAISPVVLGPGSFVGAVNTANSWQHFYDTTDQAALRQELHKLATTLEGMGEVTTAKTIQEAVLASKQNQPVRMQARLAQVGKWVLDVAIKIGVPIASKAVSNALGLG